MSDGESWLMAVDGTGLYVRCRKAARHTRLTAPDGTPTGALTLFAQSLAAMVRSVQPQRMLIAWDGGHEALDWRRRICPEYKRNRSAAAFRSEAYGDDWLREFSAVREFCNDAQILQWSVPQFEADDLLATASREAYRLLPDVKVILASDDKDILQLAADGRVWVRTLGRDGVLTDAETVELMYGVLPQNLPMLRALAGDPSDGIPGLPGIGPVKAAHMLNASGVVGACPENILEPGPERVQVSKWFSVMDLHNPPEYPEEHCPTGFLDIRQTAWKRGNILPVLERYGMRKMAERVIAGHFW